MRSFRRIGGVLLAAACLGLSSQSQAEGPPVAAADASDQDEWQFRLAVPSYLWLPNWRGKLIAGGTEVRYDLEHSDVFDLLTQDLKGMWTFFGEAKYGRFSAKTDVFLVMLDDVSLAEINLAPPGTPLNLDQEYVEIMVTPSVSYELFDGPVDFGPIERARFEPLFALRYFRLDAEGTIEDARIPSLNGRKVLDEVENYYSMLPLGAEFEFGTGKTSLFTRAMFGGWGIWDSGGGTDFLIESLIKYRVNDRWSVNAGVRWFDMNVEGDALDYEVDNSWGPIAGVIWSF